VALSSPSAVRHLPVCWVHRLPLREGPWSVRHNTSSDCTSTANWRAGPANPNATRAASGHRGLRKALGRTEESDEKRWSDASGRWIAVRPTHPLTENYSTWSSAVRPADCGIPMIHRSGERNFHDTNGWLIRLLLTKHFRLHGRGQDNCLLGKKSTIERLRSISKYSRRLQSFGNPTLTRRVGCAASNQV
jgi:hypothetical protein